MSLVDENFNLLEENKKLMNELRSKEQVQADNNQMKEKLSFYDSYGTEDEQITKQNIMKIKDAGKRQRMISENIHLFK